MRIVIALVVLGILRRHDRADGDYIRLAAHYSAVAQMQKLAEGVLIAPRWVLTAAHVGAELAPAGAFVQLRGKRYRVAAVVIDPDWLADERSGHDFALVRLEDAVEGITPVAPYSGKNEMGMTVTFVGRGATGDGNSGPSTEDGVLRGATNVVDRVDENVIGFTFDAPPRATKLEGISGPGDSGGPAIIEHDGKSWTIGVSSANASERGKSCRYDSHEIYARVSSHRDWIEKTMRDAPTSNNGWSKAVWTNELPATPLASRARAFVDAVHGDAASMRAFRVANRTSAFLESRPEAKFVATEAEWLSKFRDARLAGYATGDQKIAIFLTSGAAAASAAETWFCLVFHAGEDAKIGGIFESEIMAPAAAAASTPAA
ncbi:MAG: hypothetical protein DMF56_23535 [Acidobacteria bacterium]|nr:MAG: hypothetical protein DMF56_23535 [Acidobacteriota bacterium]